MIIFIFETNTVSHYHFSLFPNFLRSDVYMQSLPPISPHLEPLQFSLSPFNCPQIFTEKTELVVTPEGFHSSPGLSTTFLPILDSSTPNPCLFTGDPGIAFHVLVVVVTSLKSLFWSQSTSHTIT